jgi:transcriptional regulator with XRE-family HTH domain
MINNRIKNLRDHYDKNLNDIIEYIGVTKSTYTDYESGKKKPPHEHLMKLAEYYSVSVDYLLNRTNDPTPIRNLNEDLISDNLDEELNNILNDPNIRISISDFSSWSDNDKQELINHLKIKQIVNNQENS